MAVHERDLERKIQDLEARLNKALKAAAPLLDLWEPYSPNAGLSSRLVIDVGSVYLSPVRLPYRMQLSRVSILARSTAESVIHLALYKVAMARPLGDEALLQREGRPTLELVHNLGSITVASTTTAFRRHSLDLSRSVGLNPEFHYFLAAYTPDGADLFQSQVANAGAGGGYRVVGPQNFPQRVDPSFDAAPFWFQFLSPSGVYIYGLRDGSATVVPPDFSGTTSSLDITIPDNTNPAYRIREGANEYFGINTTDGAEIVRFGNSTTNPRFNFLGTGIVATGGSVIELGSAANNIRIGNRTSIGTSNNTVVGVGSTMGGAVTDSSIFGCGGTITGGQYSAAFGAATSISASYGSAFGYGAVIGTGGGSAFGVQASASNGGVALGRSTIANASQIVAGSAINPITEMILGEGNTDPSPPAVTIRTTNANGSGVGTGAAGGALTLVAGRSTGDQAGGTLALAVSPAGSSGSTLNAARNVQQIEAAGFSGTRHVINHHSSAHARRFDQTVFVETTDATTTSIFELDTSALGNGQGHVDFNIVAAGNDDNGASFKRIYRWSRVAGVLAVAALNEDVTEADAGAAAWTCVADASGGTLRVRVTGAGGVTVRWAGDVMWRFVARS